MKRRQFLIEALVAAAALGGAAIWTRGQTTVDTGWRKVKLAANLPPPATSPTATTAPLPAAGAPPMHPPAGKPAPPRLQTNGGVKHAEPPQLMAGRVSVPRLQSRSVPRPEGNP